MILITGANGRNGTELAKLLSAQGVPVRAMVRSHDRAGAINTLAGVEVVIGSFEDSASVQRALEGVDKAFLVTNSSERAQAHQQAFVEIARRNRLKHIVKLSQFAANENSPVRFLRYHAAVERRIVESGIAYTFLRPNLYMQSLLTFRDSIVSTSKFSAAAGDAKVSLVDVRDNAAAAAAVLTRPGHEGRIYALTGPEALTHAEIAATLSAAVGRPITFIDVPPAAMRQALLDAGIPLWQADGRAPLPDWVKLGGASAPRDSLLSAQKQP